MSGRVLVVDDDRSFRVVAQAGLAGEGYEVKTAASGREALEVADRGPGIAPEVQERLFEPFVTTKRSGTGLGLAIARRVVEAHGGTIAAAPRDGGGTVFRLVLPVEAAPVPLHRARTGAA